MTYGDDFSILELHNNSRLNYGKSPLALANALATRRGRRRRTFLLSLKNNKETLDEEKKRDAHLLKGGVKSSNN
jgi:hypothetical protein